MDKARLPISVIILTYNEESLIEDCLKSVHGWAKGIFVVDSFSTDRTLEIARKYTDKIYQHQFLNYSQQRNWSQDNLPISTEWVFHLDAGERATEELYEELKGIFSSGVIDVNGFLVARKTLFMGKWIKHGAHYPVYQLKIFKKDKGFCEDRLYDQHFIVRGKIAKLKGDIIDIAGTDTHSLLEKQKRWAMSEAIEAAGISKTGQVAPNKNGSPIEHRRWLRRGYYKMPLFIRPFIYFFYRYFLRFGFLDGFKGAVFHLIQGFWYRMLVDINIYKINSGTMDTKQNQ